MSTAILTSRKKALRKSLSSIIRALSREDIRTQSSAIVARVLSSPWFHEAATVSCYLSMPVGEVDTSAIASAIVHSGKHLFVPRVDPVLPGGMDLLKIYDSEDLRLLPSGVWGIKEPAFHHHDVPRMKAMDGDSIPLDVILLPGVGFDRSLSRLGHGKGYYDRFLSSYSALASARGHPKPLFVALALREQVLAIDQVPVGANDVPVDMIVTPDEVITVDGDSSTQLRH
ncbi:5-formyltetrahydrofolate cyclo-ligase [Russula earlei]|uniref:5-formyltetrahydrofolate cyclo-ligase n=1 Tax=Russula earlei TaxID=71964 RepID=A0ACC0UBG9_9AGAM|nr:5-formyltetrahydrofolate cyclo-ligase [Russula earlei]